jgi:hypothetical protein
MEWNRANPLATQYAPGDLEKVSAGPREQARVGKGDHRPRLTVIPPNQGGIAPRRHEPQRRQGLSMAAPVSNQADATQRAAPAFTPQTNKTTQGPTSQSTDRQVTAPRPGPVQPRPANGRPKGQSQKVEKRGVLITLPHKAFPPYPPWLTQMLPFV